MKLGRKITSGKYHAHRKKKLHERKSPERAVILGEPKRKTIRVRGGNTKTILLRTNIANLLINNKIQKAKIENVVETLQNRFLARQNRLLKSAIIQTSLGKARITNRPSQEGMVNAAIIQ